MTDHFTPEELDAPCQTCGHDQLRHNHRGRCMHRDHLSAAYISCDCKRFTPAAVREATEDFVPSLDRSSRRVAGTVSAREATVTPDELSEDENSQVEYFADEFAAASDRGMAIDELDALCKYIETLLAARSAALVKRIREAEVERARAWDDGFATGAEAGWEYTADARTMIESLHAQLAQAQAETTALRDGLTKLAESIHGDSAGREHNAGCEGEPDCFACIEAELRALLGSVTPDTEGGQG